MDKTALPGKINENTFISSQKWCLGLIYPVGHLTLSLIRSLKFCMEVGRNRKGGVGSAGSNFYGTVKNFMKSGRTYGTTEVTEKHSASSRKKIKRLRHREVENTIVGRGGGYF